MIGKKIMTIMAMIAAVMSLSSCMKKPPALSDADWAEQIALAVKADTNENIPPHEGNGKAWYQVFVYSFRDGDGDGIGDLAGVTSSLDYISNLGFDGIWLSPIHPSPSYHKYDVTDYYGIDPQYGTMDDFDRLMAECDKRGLSVLLDLVVNHSSSAHPWFTAAKNDENSYYHIADEPGNGNWKKLPDGRYYECQFTDAMPDFNLEDESLRAEIEKIAHFWLEKGVAGFRLDAVKEFESGNTSKNIEILRWLNGAVKDIKPDAYLVGEDWDTTDGVYDYYASGIDSLFDYPFAGNDGYTGRALLKENYAAADYISKIIHALEKISETGSGVATRAPFFTNHDNARAAGFLRRDANLIKTAWGMTIFEPGDVFVYYGEELGMSGSGKDENKRAPMFWTSDARATGMTFGPPGMDSVSHSFPAANRQVNDPDSIYNYVKSALRLRAKYPQLAASAMELISGEGKVAVVSRGDITFVYNLGEQTVTTASDGELLDYLTADSKEKPALKNGELTLPAYTIAIISDSN